MATNNLNRVQPLLQKNSYVNVDQVDLAKHGGPDEQENYDKPSPPSAKPKAQMKQSVLTS